MTSPALPRGALAARLIGLAVLAALVLIYLATRGPEPPTPNPPGSFSFAVLGDAPYDPLEDIQYPLLLETIDGFDLSAVVHVGDIFWRPCAEERYRRTLAWFNGLKHPVVYTPGDNEWYDCWERGSGGYPPQDRLAMLRRILFADPRRSLGGRPIALETQADSPAFAEFVENARWSQEGVRFATLHLVGSANGRKPFAGRASADDAAATRRTEAAVAWMQETFARASSEGAKAVVLALHASPGWEAAPDDDYRRAYEPFIEALEEEVDRFARPVLIAQGDDHEYIVDHPLVRRATGRRLANLTRVQVPGSPLVGWVRVIVTPGAAEPFAFEPHVLPRWKYW